MTPTGTVTDAAVRDSLSAVFGSADFAGAPRQTLFAWIGHWLMELFRDLTRLTGGSRVLYYAVLVAAVLLLAGIIARAVYVAHARGTFGAGRSRLFPGAARPGAEDPWSAAHRLAAEGDYTAAAHALYGAILLASSRAGIVRLHDAKTIGDYLREMRARASAAVVSGFREFARGYEYVVYGIGECDRDRYERLHGLASRVIDHA